MQSTLSTLNNFTVQSEQLTGLHVAIIMDGNGRWAARRNLPRVAGHRAGVAAVKRIVEHAPHVGIRCLTVYAFSSDNWRRPSTEVQSIFWLLRAFLRLERARLRQAGVRLEVIGRRDRIPKLLLREINQAIAATAGGTQLLLRVAIDYSSRDAIMSAALGVSRSFLHERLPGASLLRDMLAQELAAESGEVDLLIRTGGEKRLSDFLLWECAYAELWFTDRMWPDFETGDLDAALGRISSAGTPLRRCSRGFGRCSRGRRAMIAPGSRPLHVKFILPSLTEASDPYWRPIKYSLFPPLGLATLAAYLSADDHAVIVDEHVERLTLDDAPELVVIQVYITNAYRAYGIADHYRRQGAFVCLGGLHVTSLPDEAMAHADAIFLGPRRADLPKFLQDFRAGKAERVYTSAAGRTLERVPAIRRDLIQRARYLVPNSIVVTRGCPQHCDFCYKDAFFQGGRGFYTQRVEDALAEIERLPGRHLYFLDDHLLGDRRFAEALFAGMKGMKRLFQGAATVDSILRGD